ncbi:MAG: DUF4443 domain-containing protein [Nitrosopumilus sp.]
MTDAVEELVRITFKKNKILTFGPEHVFKSLQLMTAQKYVSRATLCIELELGEGSVRTILLHLKKSGYIDSIKSGNFLLKKGLDLIKKLQKSISAECRVPDGFFNSKYSYAVLLKDFANQITDGMKERDDAIRSGVFSSITLIFRDNHFVIPFNEYSNTIDDPEIEDFLNDKLRPQNNDVVVIISAKNTITAELSAKSVAILSLRPRQPTLIL